MEPPLKKSLELLRTITVEGNGFVEIDGNEFIVEGTSGLGYRFEFQNSYKMGVECYRSKDAALNPENELCLHPCIDLDDEIIEIPIGDLVFTYAMTLSNDMDCAEEIETLENCISFRDSISFSPTQKEWNEAVDTKRNDAAQQRFGGPFLVDEDDDIWFHEEFDFPEDFNVIDEEVFGTDDDSAVAGLSERSQERIDRFMLDLERS
tara:strand:- start:1608 stop:2225 length:618 start_codon:yes stop_codon:yes gene_type:complete